MNDNPPNPTPIHRGADMRCETLLQALREVIYDRGIGMPIPAILGVLRLLEDRIIRDQESMF